PYFTYTTLFRSQVLFQDIQPFFIINAYYLSSFGMGESSILNAHRIEQPINVKFAVMRPGHVRIPQQKINSIRIQLAGYNRSYVRVRVLLTNNLANFFRKPFA